MTEMRMLPTSFLTTSLPVQFKNRSETVTKQNTEKSTEIFINCRFSMSNNYIFDENIHVSFYNTTRNVNITNKHTFVRSLSIYLTMHFHVSIQ